MDYVIFAQPLCTKLAADFFIGNNAEDNLSIEGHLIIRQDPHSEQQTGKTGFHIGGAAAQDFPAAYFAAERIEIPLFKIACRDNVAMSVKEQHASVFLPHPGDDIRRGLISLYNLILNSMLVKVCTQIRYHCIHFSRRILAGNANHFTA